MLAIAAGMVVVLLAVPALLPAPSPAEGIPSERVGTVDHDYTAPGVHAPTGRKTEASRLWAHDGTWWGILFEPSLDAYTVHRYEPRSDSWMDTRTVLDDRNRAQADVLWDGSHLYAVSGGTDPSSDKDGPIVARLSYDAGAATYRMDPGFPVAIAPRGAEMFTLDRDSTGRLWVTWTGDRSVWVSHTLADDRQWSEPAVLPVAEARGISDDDTSAILAYDGGVGIMWSDQVEGAMHWASAPAGAAASGPWRVTAAVKAPAMADDHLNLKALHDDPSGLVFAAVKTSRNDVPAADGDDPLIMLLVLLRDGTWSRTVVSTVEENETRPLVLIDVEHRRLWVMTSAPCCTGGIIYERSTALDDIAFDPTTREVVLRRGRSSALNNVTSTKQPLSAATGMMVVAADDGVQRYMHHHRPLAGRPVPPPATDSGGGGGATATRPLLTTDVAADSFESGRLDGWKVATDPGEGSRVSVEGPGARTDSLGLVLAADGTPASFGYARLAVPPGGAPFSVDLDVRIAREGRSDGNVPLVRLLAPDGTRILSAYRQNGPRGQVWLRTPTARVPTLARLELDAWTHVALVLSEAAGVVRAELRIDGQLVGEATLPAATVDIAWIQLGNDTEGQAFSIAVDSVRVRR